VSRDGELFMLYWMTQVCVDKEGIPTGFGHKNRQVGRDDALAIARRATRDH
jgi:hypothetical protein